MKYTGQQAVAFCNGYNALEDTALDNTRGFAAWDARAILLPDAEKFLKRGQALQKERLAIIKRHSANEKGEIQYRNPNEPDETKRLVLFRDVAAAQAEFDTWGEKADELDAFEFDGEVPLLPKTFFDGLTLPQKVRTGFQPFLAK